jgi:hypothetical protein
MVTFLAIAPSAKAQPAIIDRLRTPQSIETSLAIKV